MASVRVTPRVRPQARQSAVRFRQPGPSAIVRPPSPEPQSSRRASVGDKPGVLPALEHPENFKDSSKCDVWVVAEKILTPGVDTSPIAAQCHQCSRTLDLVRHRSPIAPFAFRSLTPSPSVAAQDSARRVALLLSRLCAGRNKSAHVGGFHVDRDTQPTASLQREELPPQGGDRSLSELALAPRLRHKRAYVSAH